MWLFHATKTLAAADPSEAIYNDNFGFSSEDALLMRGDILRTGVLNSLFSLFNVTI